VKTKPISTKTENFMKPKKLNFANIKNVLSRAEMKKIMAGSTGGSGGGGGDVLWRCTQNCSCMAPPLFNCCGEACHA
jgi:hypothetical protein